VSRRQANRWGAQEQAQYEQQQYAAPPPAAPEPEDNYAQLEKLADLHSKGILTDEEFAAQKAKLLA
jgi:hypothetical protein